MGLINRQRSGALPLRYNFAWNLFGSGVYALCQWAMVIVLAKMGSPEVVGRFAFGLSIACLLYTSYSSRRPLRGRTGWRWRLQRLGDSWEAWRGPLLWFTWIAQWAVLYLTGSMGGAIAALTACAALTIWMAKTRSEFRLPLVMWGVALVIAAAAFGMHARHQNVLDRAMGDAGALETSKSSRMVIWRAAWAFCRDFPLGTGPGGTSRILAIYQPESMGRYCLDFAHNDIFQFLSLIHILPQPRSSAPNHGGLSVGARIALVPARRGLDRSRLGTDGGLRCPRSIEASAPVGSGTPMAGRSGGRGRRRKIDGGKSAENPAGRTSLTCIPDPAISMPAVGRFSSNTALWCRYLC